MASIVLEHVSKVFGSKSGPVVALREIDIAIEGAQFVTIVGASGCGKSTLLSLVAGFEKTTTGQLMIDGAPVGPPGPDRGVVFQQSALFPWLTVEENIAFGLSLRANRDKSEPRQRVERMLKRVGLEAFRKKYPSQLSGGMRQRAAIASVLAFDPGILLMDEPFGALDALTRSLMQDFLLEIWEESPRTVLLVTHDITEAIYLADRCVVMTSHPGTVREIIDIDLPRPRHFGVQSSPEFVRLREHVTQMVREEAAKSGHFDAHAV